MGIIVRQASWNALSIAIGTIAGAVNTVLILPRVFEDTPDDWGLIKLITAYALTGAQFLCIGAPQIISRFYPRMVGRQRDAMVTFALAIPLSLLLILGAILFLGPVELQDWLRNNAPELRGEYTIAFILMSFQTLFISLYGYMASIFKTTLFQMLNDMFQKVGYLLVVLAFALGWISFTQLLYIYTAIYGLQFLIILWQSMANGLRLRFSFQDLNKKEILNYGAYSILDRGAAVIVANLDIIMLAAILGAAGLKDIAFYTIAFYMGSVAMIPQKSISVIANPVVSKALHEENWLELASVYRKSSVTQLLIGGFIFTMVWANIDEIMLLIPEKFRGGKWVVLFIGISKMFALASGVNGAIIIFSKYYRANLAINTSLVVLTMVTNYFFIHPHYLNMGINGAALATAITFLVYNVVKTWYVYKRFGIHQMDKSFNITVVLVLAGALVYFLPLGIYPIAAIAVKSCLVTLAFALVAYHFRLSDELNTMANKYILRKK